MWTALLLTSTLVLQTPAPPSALALPERPLADVNELLRQYGACKLDSALDQVYIERLKQRIATQQATIDALRKQLADVKP